MKVSEFVNEYSESKKRKDYTPSGHIKLNYLPHTQKIVLVKGVVDAASYVTVNGKEVYKRDTPNMLFLFSMKLVETYTDIEINTAQVVNEYDDLVRCGAMDALLFCIPESEIKILKSLLDMVQDDLETNTRSLISFLETKTDSINMAINSLVEVLDKPEIKAKINELVK